MVDDEWVPYSNVYLNGFKDPDLRASVEVDVKNMSLKIKGPLESK